MILPIKLKSKTQMILEQHDFNQKTKEQAIKDMLLKGWSQESAQIIVEQLESIYRTKDNKCAEETQ